MLIRFAVTNFLSFKERTEFNMLTGNYKAHKDHIYKSNNVELLKVAAIYGANGAGKSNLILAIRFLKRLILGKVDSLLSFHINKFRMVEEYESLPTVLEIEVEIKNIIYFYKVVIGKGRLLEESLYKTDKNDDILVFERKIQSIKSDIITMNDSYLVTEKDKVYHSVLNDIINRRELFLGFSKAREKYKELDILYNWFENNLHIVFPNSKQTGLAHLYYVNQRYKNAVNRILKTLDTGIDTFDFETVDFSKEEFKENEDILDAIEKLELNPKVPQPARMNDGEEVVLVIEEEKPVIKRLITCHRTEDDKLIPFDLDEESDGTRD